MSDGGKIRLFFAVDMSEAVREHVVGLQEKLRAQLGRAFRWSAPENLHLTTNFIGEVEPEALATLEAIASQAVAGTSAFFLRVRGCGAFPSEQKARVVWAGIEGSVEPLRELQERLHGKLVRAGFPQDERAFHPHVTLGRARRRAPVRGVASCLAALATEDMGEFRVDRLRLYKSERHSDGFHYTVAAEHCLGDSS